MDTRDFEVPDGDGAVNCRDHEAARKGNELDIHGANGKNKEGVGADIVLEIALTESSFTRYI